MRKRVGGYILLEATVAMVVLSLGAITVHTVLRQGVLTRGQAQDYTTAAFLMDRLVAEVEFFPALVEGQESGVFAGQDGRYSYRYAIQKVDVPFPQPKSGNNTQKEPPRVPDNRAFMVRFRADVFWSRGGEAQQITRETLFPPQRYLEREEDS